MGPRSQVRFAAALALLGVATIGSIFTFLNIVNQWTRASAVSFLTYSIAVDKRSASKANNRNVRLLCWIATRKENHETKVKAVKETWAQRCDKSIFMSSFEDPLLPSVNTNLTEDREHLWAKTKAAFDYVYRHHFENYDWFLKADDDTYVIVENLRHLLSDRSPHEPVYFGAKFAITVEQGYMSGGAGYVLSHRALELFVVKGLPNANYCSSGNIGNEDEEMGICLEKIGVLAGDSRDSEGRHRFLPEPPQFFFSNDSDDWLQTYSYYPLKQGKDCCSPSVISFHHVDPSLMQALDSMVYRVKLFGPSQASAELPELEQTLDLLNLTFNTVESTGAMEV